MKLDKILILKSKGTYKEHFKKIKSKVDKMIDYIIEVFDQRLK